MTAPVAFEPPLRQLSATLDAAPDLAGLGARVEWPDGAIASRWQPATYTDGLWQVSLDAPTDPGIYVLVWRTSDREPPAFEQAEPFTVTRSDLSERSSTIWLTV